MIGIVKLLLWALIIFILIAGLAAYISPPGEVDTRSRDGQVMDWLNNAGAHPDWMMKAGQVCRQSPFQFPTDGFVGYLWDDSFRPGHRHQGIDIFGGGQPGDTPVYAAASGYLTRRPEWVSSVIIRLPDDPLHAGRQIWTYYTHMAGPNGSAFISSTFPPGTQEQYIEAGTLLGYQGNYSGTPGIPVGVHLHFSIVKDDGQGLYLNELEIENTLDPSLYLGMELNAHHNTDEIPLCPSGEQP